MSEAMLLLAPVCALIAACLIALAIVWQRLAPRPAPLAQEKALYAGFVADVERRLATGELDEAAANEERTAAARALLKAGEAASFGDIPPRYGSISLVVMAAAGFVLYGLFGHPQMADEPFKARLAQWTHAAQTDPESLTPQTLAMVLRQGLADHGKDPAYWSFLGRIDMLAGNNYQGAQDYERARTLDAAHFDHWSELGEALTFVAGGRVGADAQAAFAKALSADPHDARAHYYLGSGAASAGDYALARTHFEAALASMAPDDASRPMVEKVLAGLDPAQKAAQAMTARVQAMVASLAAQLKTHPDDPDGWARLIRSYDVLGNASAKAAAITAMQTQYRSRPAVAADIMARAQDAVGAENTGS